MRRALGTLLGCALLSGCGLVAGLHDLPEPGQGWGDDGSTDSFGDDGASWDVTLGEDGAPGDVEASAHDAVADTTPDAGCTCMAIPSGWTGPRALYEGDSNAPAPTCAGAYGSKSFAGNASLVAPPASCTACACGGQTGAKCGAELAYYTNACGSTSTGCGSENFALLAGTCQGLGTGSGACAGRYVQSFAAVTLQEAVGSCAPSGGTPNGGTASWNTTAVACSPLTTPPPGSCDAGQLCAPATPAPFSHLCITAPGAQSCPSGTPFTSQYVYYTGIEDTRSCTACSCGTPVNVCSASGTVSFWTAYNCSGTPTGTYTINDVNASVCQVLPMMSYYSTWTPSSFVPGSCPASGGSPTGTVTADASTAVTFCCTQ